MGYPTYPNLNKYVDQLNNLNRLFSKAPKRLSINSPKDRKQILENLRGDLSPENLTCDGELSNEAVRRKHQFLHAVALELYDREKV